MKKSLNRRKFLMAGVATATVGVVGGTYVQLNSYEALIASVVRRRLDYLTLEEDSLQTFAAAFAADYGTFGYKGSALALGRPFWSLLDPLDIGAIAKFEDRIVTRYLMSTDFFRNGANESRPVHYIAYYNPYDFACANPFAVLTSI